MKVTLEADESEMRKLKKLLMQFLICRCGPTVTNFTPEDREVLRAILFLIKAQKKELEDMATATKLDFTALAAQVKATTDLEDSAVLTLKTIQQQNVDLSKQLADAIAANDPTAIAEAQKAIDQFNIDLKTHTAALAAAIPASTPAAPPVAVDPTVP